MDNLEAEALTSVSIQEKMSTSALVVTKYPDIWMELLLLENWLSPVQSLLTWVRCLSKRWGQIQNLYLHTPVLTNVWNVVWVRTLCLWCISALNKHISHVVLSLQPQSISTHKRIIEDTQAVHW